MNTIAELNDSLIGRYLVEKEVGQGGMATVYLARDVRHDRRVAIKVLHPELAAVLGPERFVTEMKVTANLQHPHILPLFDSGTARNQLFYVMPFVEGESLRDRLQREQQLPIDEAVRITTEVAGALDYAHRHGVVHRDIKPENILLHDGTALVADFGIALAVSNAGGARLTQTGLSLGTPQYMSPEQATGDRNIDGRTDVYSLGCVLYEMLTGEPPFSGPSAQAIVAKVLTESVPAIRPRRATVSASLEAVVLKAAQRAPADRFGTPAMFAEALRMKGRDERGETRDVRTRSSSLVSRLSSLLTVAALVGITAFLLGRRGTGGGANRPESWIAERLGGPPVAMLPRVSPDGRTVAFAAMINGTTQLAVLNPGSGDWRVLTHDTTAGFVDQLSWSTDGSRIYYSRLLNGPQGVFSITPLGADDRLVLGHANSPDALPDGSIVVQQLNADRRVQLYHYWPQSGRFDTLPASADFNVGANAYRVFPDGKEIAFIGVPGAHADTNAGLWALDLATHRTRLLSRRLTQAGTGSSFGISPSGDAVLIGMAASGDAFSVLAIPRDGSDRAATLFTSTQSIYGVDAAADGTIYVDQFLRPGRLLRYQPSTRRLTNDLMSPSLIDDVLMLGDGRFVTTIHSAGIDRVMAISPGSPAIPLLPIDGATKGPVARLGDDRVLLRTGTDQDTLLVAVAATGRIVSRFPGFRRAGSVVGSPDGLTIYYIRAGGVWSMPAAGGPPRRLRDGDAVAVDPQGKYLVVETDAADRVHLFRRPLDGGSESEIPISGRIPLSPKALGPNTVAADGRILVTVVDPSRWHWPAGILDPRTGIIDVIPTGPDYDVIASWAPDGSIGAVGDGLESMLWRFRPAGGARKP